MKKLVLILFVVIYNFSFAQEEGKANSNTKWMNNYKEKKKGYFIEAEGVVSFTNTPRRFLAITNGYKFNRFAYLGLGLGVGYQEIYRQTINLEPLLEANLSFSGDVLKKRVTPFYQLSAGYSYLPNKSGQVYGKLENGTWEDSNYSYTGYVEENFGGPFGEIGVGVRVKSLKRVYYKFGVDLRVGSVFSTSKSVYYDHSLEDILITNNVYKNLNSFGSFQVRFGIGF